MNPSRAGGPFVSVVLATFNRAALLAHSAGSVLAQDFEDLELIVVDDASTDDVAAATQALRDPRVRYVRRPQNGGVAAARNTGIAAARGRYLAFQDSDDEWLPGKLRRQVEAVRPDLPDSMVVCGLRRVGRDRVRHYPGPFTHRSALTHEEVLRYPVAYTQSWLVPREAVIAAGGFDESLRLWSDWELLIRLSARLEVRVLADALVVSPIGNDSITREHEHFIRSMERILEKHAAELQQLPRALAQLKYVQGRLLGVAGRGREARAALGRALRLEPLHWRAAVLFAASLAGGARGLQHVLRLAERRS